MFQRKIISIEKLSSSGELFGNEQVFFFPSMLKLFVVVNKMIDHTIIIWKGSLENGPRVVNKNRLYP
jgi:hypothetical protein